MSADFGLGLRQRHRGGLKALFGSAAQGVWYDPSDLTSMTQDSAGTMAAAIDAPVGRIADKSGRGNHAVQANAAARPMLRQAGGQIYLEFDGVDDFLAVALALPQPWDRISGVGQESWTLNDRLFASNASNVGQLSQRTVANQLSISSGTELPGPTLAGGSSGVVTERHHGAASRVALNNGAYAIGNAGTTTSTALIVGAGTAGSSGHSHIRLYGVLMIGRALSDGETRLVRSAMAARAGVTL